MAVRSRTSRAPSARAAIRGWAPQPQLKTAIDDNDILAVGPLNLNPQYAAVSELRLDNFPDRSGLH